MPSNQNLASEKISELKIKNHATSYLISFDVTRRRAVNPMGRVRILVVQQQTLRKLGALLAAANLQEKTN